jgi:hypothetical protein
MHGYVVNGYQELVITFSSWNRHRSFNITVVLYARHGAQTTVLMNCLMVREAWRELRRQWRQKR